MTISVDRASWVPAVGGTRTVPPPDPIARDYLRLALRLDQHAPGLVHGYFGPADLKAIVDTEQLRSPAQLRDDAVALRDRLVHEVSEPDRRDWLDAQLVALESQAAALAGATVPYLDHVARCFAFAPPRRADAQFHAAATALEGLLAGDAPLADRLVAWDARFAIAVDRLPAVLSWLVGRFRERAARLFGLPEGEDLRVSLVTNQPWSGYTWFDGGRRSRVEVNTDLPVRAADLISTIAHETYPGHHLEHAWKEADLVERAGQLESSVMLINTPECMISEGLANLGRRFAVSSGEHADLLIELYARAGLAISSDPVAAREAADRTLAMAPHRKTLAAKRLEFIEHPLWRTYVFVYAEGEALLERWVGAVPEDREAARFGRLLHEQLTPATVTTPG